MEPAAVSGTVLAAHRAMWKLRHTLALSAISIVGCFSDSHWETDQGWNGGELFRGAATTPADAATSDAAANGVHWGTPFVDLRANDFRIAVDGETFLGDTPSASLNSDPGTPNAYTTLERVWTENGVEMRLFVYFYSDGLDWWANEIRIYDGQPDADWLIATGQWFRSPLGRAFTGDLDLAFDASAAVGGNGHGRLTLHGLELQAFTTPAACRGQSGCR